MNILYLILASLIGYLLGNIPCGILIGKAYGFDNITKTGSGNSGTTNVMRTLGWMPGLLTLVGDCLKGVLAAWIGKRLGGEAGMLLGGFFAVVGHDFSVFRKFKGGKGIATSLGVTWVICTPVAPWLVIIVIAIVAFVRIMSVGTLTASVSYPILFWIYMREGADVKLTMIFAVALMLLSFFCHRENIKRLIHGKENRLDFIKIGKLSEKYKLFRQNRNKK